MEPYTDVVDQYRRFTAHAADSRCFAAWAQGVVDDPEVAAWIGTLPGIKQQPNLVFAAARWHGVPAPGPYAGLREALLADDGAIRATILERGTQTNEVGRCATLLPAFATLVPDGPVALLEVGSSAGLCLYPDAYSYAWTGDVVAELGTGSPVLPCVTSGPVPVPTRLPDVAWRGGIDLNPLDVRDPDATAWLETLVWPEQEHRRERLRAAVATASARAVDDPPHVVTGDLLTALPALVAEAGRVAPPIVFHSAVIAYLAPDDRLRFDAMMRDLVADGACHWVSNESPRVLPSLGDPAATTSPSAEFVLGVDGAAVGRTHSHGAALTWLGPA